MKYGVKKLRDYCGHFHLEGCWHKGKEKRSFECDDNVCPIILSITVSTTSLQPCPHQCRNAAGNDAKINNLISMIKKCHKALNLFCDSIECPSCFFLDPKAGGTRDCPVEQLRIDLNKQIGIDAMEKGERT